MSIIFIRETVNAVENNFSADSRDKDGKRVVMFDSKRTLQLYLSEAHIVQIETAIDTKDGTDRGVILMSTGTRYITQRGAAAICAEMGKAA
jgi:hypothetical protein